MGQFFNLGHLETIKSNFKKMVGSSQRNLSWKEGGLAVSKTTAHCELSRNKGYLNLLDCHLVISKSQASYHTSSERGESGLSADLKIFTIVYRIDILQAYFGVGLGSSIALFCGLSFLWLKASNLIMIGSQ